MKRSFGFIFLILSSLFVLVSCSQEAIRELDYASVSFSGNEKSLTYSQELFDKNNYYWKYAAKKTDKEFPEFYENGETESYDEAGAVFIHEDEAGLFGVVDGFAEGVWSFLLFGYKRNGTSEPYSYSLVSSGEVTGVELESGVIKKIIVPSNKVSDLNHGDGTLFVDLENIKLDVMQDDKSTVTVSDKTVKVIRLSDSAEMSGTDGTYHLAPGVYKVDVTFVLGEYKYAAASVVTHVFANMETEITGDAVELITFADLHATCQENI